MNLKRAGYYFLRETKNLRANAFAFLLATNLIMGFGVSESNYRDNKEVLDLSSKLCVLSGFIGAICFKLEESAKISLDGDGVCGEFFQMKNQNSPSRAA
jgi:hypothetical protein